MWGSQIGSLAFLRLQQQLATQNNAGTTRTCHATAARLSRRPVCWRRSSRCQSGHHQKPRSQIFKNGQNSSRRL